MTNEVHWVVTVAIRPGQLDAFRTVMADMIASTKNETGALAYEWNFNADETECTIYERYVDSNAVATHFGNFKPHSERFVAACETRNMTVLGSPNETARQFLDRAKPSYFSAEAGFAKFAS